MGKPDSITICQFGFLRSELDNLPSMLNLTNRGPYATRVMSGFDTQWNELDLHGPLLIHARAFTSEGAPGLLHGEPAPAKLHNYHDEGAILVILSELPGMLVQQLPSYVYAIGVTDGKNWSDVLNKLCPMQEKVANATRKIIRDIAGANTSRTWENYGHRLDGLFDMLNETVELRAHINKCPICERVFSIAVNRPPGV